MYIPKSDMQQIEETLNVAIQFYETEIDEYFSKSGWLFRSLFQQGRLKELKDHRNHLYSMKFVFIKMKNRSDFMKLKELTLVDEARR